MMVILLLMGAGLIVAGAFLALFLWAVRSGQYDDPVTPGWRVVLDDQRPRHSAAPASRHANKQTSHNDTTSTEGNDVPAS